MSAFANTMHESFNFSEVYYYYSCESQQLDQFTQEPFMYSWEQMRLPPSTCSVASVTTPGTW